MKNHPFNELDELRAEAYQEAYNDVYAVLEDEIRQEIEQKLKANTGLDNLAIGEKATL